MPKNILIVGASRGLGLGLAICDTLTRALGGELRMSNHAEGGAQLGLFLRSAEPGVAFPTEDHFQ